MRQDRAVAARCFQPVVDHPRDDRGRRLIGVRGLLEWAFGTEFASLEYDELDGGFVPSFGNEYRIMQQLALGKEPGIGVRVDTSFGRSHPHDDAELVASVLRHSVEWHLAVRVAEFARTCRAPVWDLGPQHLRPKVWGKENQHGSMGKAEVYREVTYVSRGRRRTRKDMWVPCIVTPSVAEIAAARRAWLDWWGALLAVRGGLRHVELTRWCVTDRMPQMTPWRKGA